MKKVILILLTLAAALSAQIPDFKVNSGEGVGNSRPWFSDITIHSSGKFIVVWEDERNGDDDIFGQLFSAEGTLIGNNFRINDDQNNAAQYVADVAFDINGNFIVAWMDRRNEVQYSNSDIYAQAFDFNGNPIGNNFIVSDPDNIGWHWSPAIAFQSDGSFIITWTEYWGEIISAQMFSANREKIGEKIKVNTNEEHHLFDPDIAVNSNGDFVICWQGDTYWNRDVNIQIFDKKGGRIGSNFTIHDSTDWLEIRWPSVDYLSNNSFVVTWEEEKDSKYEVYAQIFSEQGERINDIFKIDEVDTSLTQFHSSVSSGMSDQFIITWEREDNIFAQRFKLDGTKNGAKFRVDEVNDTDCDLPVISTNSNGDFVVTWSQYQNNRKDIFIQQFTAGGDAVNENKNPSDADMGAFQGNSVIAVDSVGNFIIAWQDEKNGDDDICAMIFDKAGVPITDEMRINDDEGANHQSYPVIALNKNGKILIVWNDGRDERNNIYGQFLTMSGSKDSSNFKISESNTSFYPFSPAVDCNKNRFVITWTNNFENSFGSSIYAQLYDGNSVKIGSNFKASDDVTEVSKTPYVGIRKDGSFIITWKGLTDRAYHVFARRYSKEGIPSAESFKVNISELPWTSQNQAAPVIIDKSGNTVICWTEYRNDQEFDIYYSKFGVEDQILISNKKIIGPTALGEYAKISLASNDNNDLIVAWEEKVNESYDVLVKKIDGSSSDIFRLTNTSAGIQYAPNIKVTNNKIFATWTDNRIENSGFDVWANNLDWDFPLDIDDEIGILTFELKPNYPNPFNPSTRIEYTIPSDVRRKT